MHDKGFRSGFVVDCERCIRWNAAAGCARDRPDYGYWRFGALIRRVAAVAQPA
jgi:hypothetical protein